MFIPRHSGEYIRVYRRNQMVINSGGGVMSGDHLLEERKTYHLCTDRLWVHSIVGLR